jgi:3-oxochol-4-en-24-oyl-CoA dehydrogenase
VSIGLSEDHAALAESVRGFVARYAPVAQTRERLADHPAGALPDWWDRLVEQGLTSLHLPEEHDGAGAGLVELAVVLEETAAGLLPGPLLPSVLTSAVLARYAENGLRKSTLGRFAAGTRGATALTVDGLTAVRDGAGYTVSGATVPVLGAVGAEVLLLGARTGEGEVWFVLEPSAGHTGVTIDTAGPVDHTRAVGTVTLAGLAVTDEQVVAVDAAQVRALAAVAFAAEAVGLARWCVRTGIDYVKVREQFGRPVGSFQAIKHKCARMFIRAEVMAAAAWDAARAVDQGDDQLALAAAEAAIVCLPGATETGLDTITLLGGIGYTWEHDTHLYWRRAMTLENLLGPVSDWERRLGELAGSASRDFAVDLPEEDPAFRARIAAILAEVATVSDQEGLVLPHYPRPYGLAASPVEQIVILQEYERSGVEQPKTVIGEWALPTILAHGTQEQQDTFVPATLRGEITWCQLFSEPGAGSDLAALSTRAEKVDGGWRLNGQKVWTSNAHLADYGICLARTDPAAPKHKGISYFLVDMRSPGLEVRPLREANGNYMFNEVFFNDVFVPDNRLVGEVNQGWPLARTTLGNERVSMGGMHEMRIDLTGLARSGALAAADTDVRRDVGACFAQAYALAAMGLRSTLRRLSGLQPGAEASVAKTAAGWSATEVHVRAMRWLGPLAATADGPGGAVVHQYLSTPPVLIGGGTPEIQLNVIAERILGLPRG